MKKIAIIITILMAVALWAGTVDVVMVNGSGVSVIRNDVARSVKSGDKLYKSDIIKTDAKSGLKVKLSNGSIVQVNPNCEIRVSQLIPDKVVVKQSMWLSSLKSTVSKFLTSNEAANTPSAVCGVRGNEVGENRFKVYWDKGKDDPGVAYEKIHELYKNGFYSNAVDQLKKYVAAYPDEKEKGYYLMGLSYFALQNFGDSIDAFKEVGDYADDTDFLIGVDYLYSLDFNKAIDHFKSSMGKVDSSKIYYFMALAYKGLDDNRNSRKYLRKIDKSSEFYGSKI